MKKLLAICCVFCVTSAGASQPPITPSRARGVATSDPTSVATQPTADHHVHIVGPNALPLADPVPPEVGVPREIAALLSARAALIGGVADEARLSQVYTSDAQVLNSQIDPTGWMRNPYWVMRFLNLYPSAQRRLIPNLYSQSGSIAYVAGTLARSDNGRHTMTFLFGLRRAADGSWRIAVETTAVITPPRFGTVTTAEQVVSALDEGGVRRGVIISEALWLGSKGSENTRRQRRASSEAEAVRAENNYVAEQVALYPERLVMACSVNPLRDYALAELKRCAGMRQAVAMKLNFGDSGIEFGNTDHVSRLRSFFEAANRYRLALIVHIEPGVPYGAAEVRTFLDEMAAAAPDIPIQLAHMAGDGPGVTSPEALGAFADAIANLRPGTRNLYFDLGGVVHPRMRAEDGAQLVALIRRIGINRILFATDFMPGVDDNAAPAEQWSTITRKLPLTDSELRLLATNVAPYVQR